MAMISEMQSGSGMTHSAVSSHISTQTTHPTAAYKQFC